MTHETPKVSILIPAFNEGGRIWAALESVLFQRTTHPFEVIVVDDGSTDNTAEMVQEYQKTFPNLRLLINPGNVGKGASMMKVYAVANGEYVHVLDADDYFTSFDKIEKQIKFLDENENIFAVAHNSLIIHPDKTIEILSNNINNRIYSYEDCVQFLFYFHTSSYMFRKLHHNLPEVFGTHKGLRGDSAFTYYHAFCSKKGVHFLSDIASVYDYHGQGIWSSLLAQKKKECLISMLQSLQKIIIKDPSSEEHTWLDLKIQDVESKNDTDFEPLLNGESMENSLKDCLTIATGVYRKDLYEKVFGGMHALRSVDQVCESLGRVLMVRCGYSLFNRRYDEGKIAILVAGLLPTNGGIFAEVETLAALHTQRGLSVLIVVSGAAKTEPEGLEALTDMPGVEIVYAKEGTLLERTQDLIDILWKAAPYRLHAFISHHDVAACAALQKGLAKEIIFPFVFDHGSTLGLWNSAVDKVIFKSARQVVAASAIVPEHKRLLIPPLVRAFFDYNPYTPLKNGTLTTASASARAYKVEAPFAYPYCDVIADILAQSGGTHIHFGPLTQPYLVRIKNALDQKGVPQDRFVHIPFAAAFSKALHEKGVDIFLGPFPVPSARIAAEVLSCGIPMLCYKETGSTYLDSFDFCDPHQWAWQTPQDIVEIIKNITPESLMQKSHSARAYFEAHHDITRHGQRMTDLIGEEIHLEGIECPPMRDIIADSVYDFGPLKTTIWRSCYKNECDTQPECDVPSIVPPGIVRDYIDAMVLKFPFLRPVRALAARVWRGLAWRLDILRAKMMRS